MGLCFKLSRNELTQYTWDYLENPKSKFNPDTRRREFWSNIAFSRTKSKRRPEHDPLNDIQ
jgi:YD repeat-containing protein